MAGGKETPRQKMVGLMYLVLLALLALQVGAEIMTKFRQLNDSLGNFVHATNSKNQGIVDNIEKQVNETKKDDDVLKDAKDLKAKTAEIQDAIEAFKEKLVKETGGIEEGTGVYLGMKDTDKSAGLLIGQGDKTNGFAYDLEKMLNDYIAQANVLNTKVIKRRDGDSTVVKAFDKLALSGKEDPLFSHDKEKARLDFAHLNFDHTPMIASLAFLTDKQSKLAAVEGELLNNIASLVGASDFKFDNVFAMSKPNSSVVAAGTMYEAELFVSASSKMIKPKMSSSVGGVTMDGNVGHIKFRASGGAYDKYGNQEKSWTGNIAIKKPVGSGDTTLKVVTKYTVSKPVIQVQADAVSALYRNCANPLRILVPALGADYNPTFTTTGGQGKKGKATGDYIVFPGSGKKVAITVTNGGSKIGTETFKVKGIPRPEIVAYANNKPINEKQGMAAPGPRSITVKAIADKGFKDALPREARYKVTAWSATLVRGRRPAAAPKKFGSGKGDLSSLRSKAKPNDRIMIEVNDVVRINSRNQSEKVPVGIIIKNLPLN